MFTPNLPYLRGLFLFATLFVTFSANAANIAFLSSYGSNTLDSLIPTHTITQVTLSDIDSGALSSYDALIMGHVPYTGWSATTCSQLETFILDGKGLITEWNGVQAIFTQDSGNYGALDYYCGFYTGTVSGGGSTWGSDLPITIINSSSALATGLSDPFSMGPGSEFVYQITGYDTAEWSIAGTYDGGGTDYPAIMSASYQNTGCISVSPFDYFDASSTGGTDQANYEQLLKNLVEAAIDNTKCDAYVPTTNVGAPKAIPSSSLLTLLSLSILLGLFIARRRFG